MNAYELLKRMKEKSASDLYLKVGLPPSFRIHGEVIRDTTSPLSAENVKVIVDCLLNDYQKRLFNERPDLDFAYPLKADYGIGSTCFVSRVRSAWSRV